MIIPQLSQEMSETIDRAFHEAKDTSRLVEGITPYLADSPLDERRCLEFLYAYMPFTDMATYDFILFRSFARAALRARARFPWGMSIPTEIFFNYVLFYRVNDENIEDHRELFCEELAPRLNGKSMMEAAIEVNLWCCEKAAYRSTDDRTASPLTVIKCGYGRCGEESTLLVCALRSVGIPARQCYVPRWSHCDDNHAWVEAYIDGKWHYFGACEPEPAPNRGWFTHAASRAMLVHSRAFSPLPPSQQEDVVSHSGPVSEINCLSRYADVRQFTVKVLDDGWPLPGAHVKFEVLNYSELYPITEIITNENGEAYLLTGLGDLFLSISSNGRYICEKTDTRTADGICVDLSHDAAGQSPRDFDFYPPSPLPLPLSSSNSDIAKAFSTRLEQAEMRRRRYEDTFYTLDMALSAARKMFPAYPTLHAKIADFLVCARGNHPELLAFLCNEQPLPLKLRLLEVLSIKDMTDLRTSVLNEHITYAREYEGIWPDEFFARYVLSPRIGNEYLYAFRAEIIRHFTPWEKVRFQEDPRRVANYIRENIHDSGDQDILVPCSPIGLLKLCRGSELSKKYLFVAVCRTFGIPARINPVDGQAEFFAVGDWHGAFMGNAEQKTGRLILTNIGTSPLVYRQNYTIAKLEHGAYRTICLSRCTLTKRNETSVSLKAGIYRIITANRQIDGSILARFYDAELRENTDTLLSVELRKSQLRSRLYSLQPSCLSLMTQDGADVELKSILRAYAPCVLAALDIGKEPTEHLLNEIIEMKDKLNKQKLRMVYLVHTDADLTHATYQSAAAAIPSVLLVADKENFPPKQLFEDLKLGDPRLPLTAVINGSGLVVFAFSNYNVGTVDLLLQIVQCTET